MGLSGPFLPSSDYPRKRLGSFKPVGLSGPFLPSSDYLRKKLGSFKPMGLSGLEPPTSRLSGVRSNRLSSKPSVVSDARKFSFRMETKRFELSTPCLQGRCSPN